MDYSLFAVSAPGLETFTAQELLRLFPLPHAGEGPGVRATAGGVVFSGDLRAIYRANLHLRTASRVLVRLGEFSAVGFAELCKKAGRLTWEKFLAPGQPVALRVTCHKSKLYHSDAVAERIAGAIEDKLGKPVERRKGNDEAEENPAQLVVVRLNHDVCTISVDSSGELLHRRGYRLASTKAPLRETLAAGMLLAARWDMRSPLLDPFCGSGTIAIEAALMAQNIPPGLNRRFAFMDWPRFDSKLWQALIANPPSPVSRPLLLASDRDAGAIEAARANADRAGVGEAIEFTHRAVSAIEPPGEQSGWVITNPPYGVRVGEGGDLRNLYAQLGKVLRAKCAGWRMAMLNNDMRLARQTGLDFDAGLKLVNGGLPVKLIQAMVPPTMQG